MRHQVDAEEAWEYTDDAGLHRWTVRHVVARNGRGRVDLVCDPLHAHPDRRFGDVIDPPEHGLPEPGRRPYARGMKESLFERVGVSSEDSWEYENRGGLLEWAQAHVVLAIVSAAFAWFAVVFLITLVVRSVRLARPPIPCLERGMLALMRWPVAISLVIVLLAGGLWYAKLRQRADAATVQDHIALQNPGSTIGCSELKANGSLWACAVVYPAESVCRGRRRVGHRTCCCRHSQPQAL